MLKFTPSSRRNPCPICDDMTGDCRSTDTGLILCHTFIDKHQDPSHPDWEYRKPDKSGIWGIFSERREEQTRYSRDYWREHTERIKREREQEKLDRGKQALSIDDRDKWLRVLSAGMGLTDGDRQRLKDRGLTEQQITDGLFFSYQPGQKVSDTIPGNLPGIRRGKLAGKHSGIACVAFDVDGKAIGYQVRLNTVTDGGKYRWGYGQASSHLPNGELPLNIAKATNGGNRANPHIGLTEGLLKPYVTACRLGIDCIGAAGGNHAGSNEQLKTAIDSLLTDDPEQFIVIYPDAGAILNKNVRSQYQATANLITDWGYGDRLRFAWWKQITKDGQDCDEINPGTEIQYLTVDQFFILAWQQQQWEYWRKTKDFTSQIKLNQQHLDFKAFEDKAIYFIKSGLGSGKTTNIRAWIDQNREWLLHNRLHFQGYRNNLLLQNCEGIPGLIHIHQFGECDYICDPDLWAAYCLDSILKFKPEDFDDAVIVLDEIVSVIKHLLFANTEISKYREKAISLFIEAIKRARTVICLDGNMADWVVEFMKGICPDKEITTIENTYQTPRPDLYWLSGGINDKGILSANDYKPLIDRILAPDSIGAKAVTSDSQTALQTIDSLLTGYGKITLRIDRTTSGTERVKAFLENPTRWLQDNHIDYLLYSPTAESGLDIPITDYFTAHYCLFFGVLDVDSTLQMIARVRDINCPKYFWARSRSTNDDDFKSPLAETLKRVTNERLNHDLNRALSGEVNGSEIISQILETYQRPLKVIEDTAFKIQAQRNFESANLRECLLERLIVSGYPIHYVDPEQSKMGTIYKEEREAVLKEESEKIFNAELKPVNKLNRDRIEDQRSLSKIKLLNNLPGIENDQLWSEDFVFTVLFKERQLIPQVKRAWMLAHPEVFPRLEKEQFKRKHDRYFDDRHSLSWLDRNEPGKMWALSQCGILDILNHPDPDKVFGPDDPEIQNVIQQGKRKAIYLHLGRQGKRGPMQYVGGLLQLVGAGWEGKRIMLKDGSRVREYRVNRKQHDRPEWIAISHSLDRKWWKYTDTELAPIDWSPPPSYYENQPENDPKKLGGDQTLQIQSGKDFDWWPPDGGGVIQFTGAGGHQIVPEKTGDNAIKNPEYRLDETVAGDNVVILNPETMPGDLDWHDFIAQTDKAITLLGWGVEQSKQFLMARYGKKSRLQLTDGQVFDLWLTLYNLTLSLNHNPDNIKA